MAEGVDGLALLRMLLSDLDDRGGILGEREAVDAGGDEASAASRALAGSYQELIQRTSTSLLDWRP
jgi:hypothetical protein